MDRVTIEIRERSHNRSLEMEKIKKEIQYLKALPQSSRVVKKTKELEIELNQLIEDDKEDVNKLTDL